MQTSRLVEQLMASLRSLPGVGPKTAQRMAFSLLQRQRAAGLELAKSLHAALTEVGHCEQCRTFTEQVRCTICDNPKRQQQHERHL